MSESSVGGAVRAVLEVREVTAADAGPYTCRATNPHGDHSQVFTIAIIGKCGCLVRQDDGGRGRAVCIDGIMLIGSKGMDQTMGKRRQR